ncbi:MAG: hypothetical protein K6E53_02305 [Lachnospiraceae bacterium]|nr:hypothetical protein [Lachnospiraceae bacterium]
MKNGSIKIMSIIALILQTLAVVAGLGTVVWQKILVRAFVNMPTDSKIMVFPASLLFVILQLFIYIAFFSISQKEGNSIAGIVLIVLSVMLAVTSVFGNAVGSVIYARMGVEAVAVYSSITSITSYINALLVIPAEAVFYIACGRYTAKSE